MTRIKGTNYFLRMGEKVNITEEFKKLGLVVEVSLTKVDVFRNGNLEDGLVIEVPCMDIKVEKPLHTLLDGHVIAFGSACIKILNSHPKVFDSPAQAWFSAYHIDDEERISTVPVK